MRRSGSEASLGQGQRTCHRAPHLASRVASAAQPALTPRVAGDKQCETRRDGADIRDRKCRARLRDDFGMNGSGH
jgi:hypothetical protein